VVNGDSSKLLWKVYDFNKECPVDLDLYFINKTFAVTDLDKNGIAEVWIMYKNYCHGDISPVPTKIIMYEGNTKYALRGESRVNKMGGNYTLDDNFRKGNVTFKQYAKKLWTQKPCDFCNTDYADYAIEDCRICLATKKYCRKYRRD
jgi:hypothetical protein